AGIAGFAVFLLYLITLAPTTAMWDTSEYITAAYTLGLPHPPANPLFVLVGWLPVRWQRIAGASVGTIIGATAFTVWNQSVVNEKVYTVSLLGIAVISWLMIRWSDDPDGRTADRILVFVAY